MPSPLAIENGSSVLQAAYAYCRRGWSVIPIPHKSKNPRFDEWQRLRLTADCIDLHFNGRPQNLGVLLGEPSDWLVDVDLDHPRAVELAEQFLPPTPLQFGRLGKPRSHRIYRVSAPIDTKKFKSRSAGMVVELRSTGAQTVFPPSTHESGEAISWETQDADPAVVEPAQLLDAIQRLAHCVLAELGEIVESERNMKRHESAPASHDSRLQRCLAAMIRMEVADHKDGSGRLFAVCCRAVEHDLSDEEVLAVIRQYVTRRPFPKKWSDDDILKRVRDAEDKCQRGCALLDSRPTVVIDTDEHRVISETIATLGADEDLFHRGGMLVRVLRDLQVYDGVHRSATAPTIGAVPPANLRERLTRHARFVRRKNGDPDDERPVHPASWLVGGVDSRGHWDGLRRLIGVSDVPILHADGTVFQTPGYDEQTGVLFEPSADFDPIADDVTVEDARHAAEEILDVVSDFQFESAEHSSACLAGMLTPLARFAYSGPSPFFLIDANVRGAGKGLLARTIGWINLGHEISVSSYSHDVEEMRKKITAIAMAGDRLVLLDNLEGRFGNDVLDRALTTTRWKDRVLGKSQQVDLPLVATWYGTGNNVAVGADTARRIVHIRLDVLEEHPEQRQGFRRPDLIEWVRSRRSRLVGLGLTMLAAYCRAGRPDQSLTPFGSFEGWSDLVRSAVVWAGLSDPCLTRLRLAATSDTTADTLEQLMAAWHQFDPENQGIVVAEMVAGLYPPQRDQAPVDDASVAMRAALENLVGDAPSKVPGCRQVGNRLRTFRRRVINGQFLDTVDQRRGGALWKLWTTPAASLRL